MAQVATQNTQHAQDGQDTQNTQIVAIDTQLIDATENNRRDFSDVHKLAESIAEHGQHTPAIVRQQENDRYLLIAGERRTRACELLGIPVRAIVRDDLDDKDAYMVTLSENDARSQTNDIEKAEGYRRAINEFGLTVEELARELGKRVDYIERRLSLLALNDDIKKLVADAQLGIAYAAAMTDLNSDFQRVAMRAFNNNDNPRPAWFREVCGDLLAKQSQTNMFGLFGDDDGAMTSLLDDIETKHEPPPDPKRYTPTFDAANMTRSVNAELAKWADAADKWDRYGNGRKANESLAIVRTLRAMANALNGHADAQHIKEEADRILATVRRHSNGQGLTTKKIMQYGNVTSDEVAPILEHLVNHGRLQRKRSGRGYRYIAQ